MQNHKPTSKHYLKVGEARMKHQMTHEEANEQKPRAEMLPVRISQHNKICGNKGVAQAHLNRSHISKCLNPSTSPSLILDGMAQTGR